MMPATEQVALLRALPSDTHPARLRRAINAVADALAVALDGDPRQYEDPFYFAFMGVARRRGGREKLLARRNEMLDAYDRLGKQPACP